MKFTYDESRYDIRANAVLFLGFLLVLLSKSFLPDILSLAGVISGMIVAILSLVFKAGAIFQRRFAFFITNNALKVHYNKYESNFLWQDILNIIESESGFDIQTNRLQTRLFISGSMKDCKTFKTMLLEKATLHKIPWTITEGGEG